MSVEGAVDETGDSDDDTVEADLVRDLVTQLNTLQDRVDELEGDLSAQRNLTDALRNQNAELKRIIAGSDDAFDSIDGEHISPLYPRIKKLESRQEQHAEKFEMFVVEDGKTATPDERALHLRQVIYNKAQEKVRTNDDDDVESINETEVHLKRDQCTSALGATLARSSIIEAMKRAADGHESGDPDAVAYTPIQGSSDLQPVDAIEYRAGRSIGTSGGVAQSRLVLEVGRLTGIDHCKIPTTVSEGGRGV